MPKHHIGKKSSKSHTTVIDASEAVVEFAENLPLVTKVSKGEIKRVPGGSFRIKCKVGKHSLTVDVRGNNSIQTLYVFSKNCERVKCQLEGRFPHSN